jgi:hypothetical protein
VTLVRKKKVVEKKWGKKKRQLEFQFFIYALFMKERTRQEKEHIEASMKATN